jgi:hypothetical protein
MPFTLVATLADVRARAKEFSGLDDTEVNMALADATSMVNVTIFGGPTSQKTVLAQVYVAAHLLSMRNPALATPAGAVVMERVGDVQATYAVPTSSRTYTESDWNQSRWGREYMTLYRSCSKIKFVVAGGPIPDAPGISTPVEVIE